MKNENHNINSNFSTMSKIAAEHEKNENFESAIIYWRVAVDVAIRYENKDYAEKRLAYCMKSKELQKSRKKRVWKYRR